MPNRLASARSPYLLQHAHNPVDWYPWGDEAFDKARTEAKPVFLSVGYSACHWCHVMERESFEDVETAARLNAHFVSIKVDREERPDVDQIYQLALQVLTQRAGGWPLSMFLTPDKRPFFGGTYFPDQRRHGMPSFREVLDALTEAYRDRRDDVTSQADELTTVLAKVMSRATAARLPVEPRALLDATEAVMTRADRTWGGFGRAPKFPNTMTVDVLLIAAATRGHTAADAHVWTTLDRMARGGMRDHLGGGFARYSTDERWLIPHFEKMLYDNAQLARVYLDGWRALGDRTETSIDRSRCEAVVRETLTYVLREMTDATGAFYSAQDADSEGVEGKFFGWTPSQLEAVLGAGDARVIARYFNVSDVGNFEHGQSVLWTPEAGDVVAAALGISPAQLEETVARARPKLWAAREQRVKPMRDDKCLVGWNALMISAMVDAGATWQEGPWIDAARKALEAWRSRGWNDGVLAHAMKHGETYGAGFLDDYAGLGNAAIDVFEATDDASALAFARALGDAVLTQFWDASDGGFFFSSDRAEVVLLRTKDPHDHAYPGGAGLAASLLLRLATLTGHAPYRDAADRFLANTAAAARENPMGLGTVVRAVDRAAGGAIEVVVMGDPLHPGTQALLGVARRTYLPHRTLVTARDAAEGEAKGLDPALVRGRGVDAEGRPQAYVCRGMVCDAPVSDPVVLAARLVAFAAPNV